MLESSTTILSAVLLLSTVACGSKTEDKPDDKAKEAKQTPDAKAGDAATPTPEPEAKPEVAPPKLTETAVADWGIKVGLPEGAAVTEVEAGDAEAEMPDSATLTVESACGYDIDLTRHWATGLDSMYENSKKGMVDGLTDVEWLKDEKTATGYTIHYKGKAPLGDMYGMSRGVVVGDRLVLCDSGLGRAEQHEAACLLAICESIVPAG